MAPSGERGTWKALGEVSSIGVTLVVTTVIGSSPATTRTGGSAQPWLLLLGLGFGIAAGFVNLFRSVKRAERELDDSGELTARVTLDTSARSRRSLALVPSSAAPPWPSARSQAARSPL